MKKVLRIALYTFLSLLVLLLLVAGATQTQLFRNQVRAYALSQLDTLLLAKVQMGSIQGNLIAGFSIDDVSLSVDGAPVIKVERIDLRYNLLALPGHTISVRALRLVRPEIHLVRGMDSVWNFSRIARPSTDTSASRPFDWTIAVGRFEIQDGRFVYADSLAINAQPPLDSLRRHLHDFTVHGIDMVVQGTVAPKEKHVIIAALRGLCEAPDIALHQLTGEFTVTPTEAQVRDLRIVTERSSLDLNAALKKVDIVGGIEIGQLEHSPVRVDLQASPVDLDELQQLLPPLEFLRGPARLDLATSGEFGRMKIDHLALATGRSEMRWTGMLTHLHHPRDLALDVKLADGHIHPGDLPVLMPPFHLPDFGSLGMTTLNIEFAGKPLDFKTRISLATSAGTVRTEMAMKIGGKSTLEYEGTVGLDSVNPGPILENDALEGSFNGSATIAGRGVSIEDLASTMDLSLDASTFRGLAVPPSHLHLEGINRVLAVDGTFGLGNMTATLSAHVDRRNSSLPSYGIEGEVHALNLADVLHDTSFDSDLSMRMRLQAQGASLASLDGDAALTLSSSRFRDYRVDSNNVTLSVRQSDPTRKRLSLQSTIADFSLTGSFNLPYVSRLMGYEIQNLRLAAGDRLGSLDSSFVPPIDRKTFTALGEGLAREADSIDAEYSLLVKDLEPVSVVAGDRRFQGSGNMHGAVRGSYRSLNLEGNLGVNYFVYGNVERGVLLKNAAVSFRLQRLMPLKPMQNASFLLKANADKIHINHGRLDSLALGVSYENDRTSFSLRGISDSLLQVSLGGTGRITDAGIAANVDSVLVGYKHFVLRSDTVAQVAITRSDVSIRNLALRHDSTSIRGSVRFAPGKSFEGTLSGRRINLADMRHLLSAEESGVRGAVFHGGASFDLSGRGSLDDPSFALSLHAHDISFRRVPFGRLDVECGYADTTLRVSLQGGAETHGDTLRPSLTVSGTLPINLAFTADGDRFPEKEMDLSILSDGTQINILDPLLPSFNEMSGLLEAHVSVKGTPRHPLYSGTMNFNQCSFLFVPNNIRYLFNAKFQPEGERIKVLDAELQNVEADQGAGQSGEVHIKGDFRLRDFVPGDFNLTATGALLVVKETSRLTALSLYGNLFAEFGDEGLHFTGDVGNSLLKGSISIANSHLVFPPTQTVAEEESPLSIPLVFLDDTTTSRSQDEPSELSAFFEADSSHRHGRPDADTSGGVGFVEGIHYDLDIDASGGTTQVQMIFNSTTNEELLAFIDGNVRVTGDGREWFGDLTVSRAYYNFFKRFDAEGQMSFTGNVLNPTLNITATYKGQRTIGDSLNETVVVTSVITGTRLNPKAAISMTIQGVDYEAYNGPKSNDVQSDAIQFVLYGAFPLTAAQRGSAQSDILSTIRGSLTSISAGLLTGALSDYLKNETGGFVSTVSVETNNKQTDLRLSGMAWQGYWQYKGDILQDPLSSANFSILYSFGTIFNTQSLRNLMFELERTVEANPLSPTNELKRTNSARLFYRFSF